MPRSPVRLEVVGAEAASLYAITRSFLACSATASAVFLVAVTMPGGNPVKELALPGLRPRLPVITVGPVLVIVCPARTVKLRAVPSLGWVAANAAAGQVATAIPVIRTSREATLEFFITPPLSHITE